MAVAAAASARVAGICGELLHDRIEFLCASGDDGLGAVRCEPLADVVAAGERFQTAVRDALETIDPSTPGQLAAIVEIACRRVGHSLSSSCDARRRIAAHRFRSQ
jgi:hypothetical protein